jgi:tRNA-2-methylthio-N6-dimethylallyladenosine synthase
MTDHIVVFEGNERLIGRTVSVLVREATAFTLFGDVVTGEQVGVESEVVSEPAPVGESRRRFALPLI